MTTIDAGSAPTVVLLHSLGADRSVWQLQAEALERSGRRVLLPESRGHGAKPWTPGVTFDAWSADLHEWLQSVVDGPVHLVGLTMGGMQAIAYAADHPEMVRSLVLVGTFAQLDPETRDTRLAAVHADIERLGMRQFAEAYVDQTLQTEAARLRGEVLTRAIAQVPAEVYLASCELCFSANLTGLLSSLRMPTLVVAGELDAKTPVPVSRQLAASIPGARLVVLEGAGHLSNLDAPEAFDSHLQAFLDGVEHEALLRTEEPERGRGAERRA